MITRLASETEIKPSTHAVADLTTEVDQRIIELAGLIRQLRVAAKATERHIDRATAAD